MNSFDKNILRYCRQHPDDPTSQYFMKCIEEGQLKHKDELRKWRMIGKALVMLHTGSKTGISKAGDRRNDYTH